MPTSPFPGPRGHPGSRACLLVPRWASGLWSRGQLSRSACPQPGLLPGLPLGKRLLLLPFLPGFRGCRLLLSLLPLHQNYRPPQTPSPANVPWRPGFPDMIFLDLSAFAGGGGGWTPAYALRRLPVSLFSHSVGPLSDGHRRAPGTRLQPAWVPGPHVDECRATISDAGERRCSWDP